MYPERTSVFRYISRKDGRVPLYIPKGRPCSVMYPVRTAKFRYVSSEDGRVPLCIQ